MKTCTALAALLLLIPSAFTQTVAETGYINIPFGYRVAIPEGYTVAPIVTNGVELGAVFTKGANRIFVRATPVDHANAAFPFDEYVKVAGLNEVSANSVLSDIEPLVTESADKGFRTVWTQQRDNTLHDKNTSSLFPKDGKKAAPVERTIYYMPISIRAQFSGEFVKAVSIVPMCSSGDCAEVDCDAQDIAVSYRPSGKFENFFDLHDNGKTFCAEIGQNIVIELPSNPTTGFNWQFDKLDKTAFEVVNSSFVYSASQLSGAGGLEWWELKPLKPGRQKISLVYSRSWEKQAPANEMVIHFTVAKPE